MTIKKLQTDGQYKGKKAKCELNYMGFEDQIQPLIIGKEYEIHDDNVNEIWIMDETGFIEHYDIGYFNNCTEWN